MILYLIKSSLCLAAFLLVYNLVFERENMHVFKRFYLLTGLVFSFVVPFISFEFQGENTIAAASNTVQSIVLPNLELTANANYLPSILYSIYVIIILLFAFRFFQEFSNHL